MQRTIESFDEHVTDVSKGPTLSINQVHDLQTILDFCHCWVEYQDVADLMMISTERSRRMPFPSKSV